MFGVGVGGKKKAKAFPEKHNDVEREGTVDNCM